MEIIFWSLIMLVFYTYIGYGILLVVLVKIRGSKILPQIFESNRLPEVTHIIAAYNEEDYIEAKIKNALSLDYPSSSYEVWVVADGSTDNTMRIVEKYPNVKLFYQPERKGKIHAVNRIMPQVQTPVVIFSDANTEINSDAIYKITRHYEDEKVGCVSGEKRIKMSASDDASAAGEGIYWKYESFLKKYDYHLHSVVGAAGELFSIRTDLYEEIQPDTLIEDFYLSLSIAKKGFRIAYEPEAYAVESSSASVDEESKRKIRIAAGGHQAIWRLRSLLNIFRYGILSFQFISHRVLRWTLAPLALPLLIIINIFLATHSTFYIVVLACQVLFYAMAALGYYLQKRKLTVKPLFVPFYFTFMNISVYKGFVRFIRGRQSVVWEKAKRSE